MEPIKVRINKISPLAKIPEKGSMGAAAFDLYFASNDEVTLVPFERKLFPTGLKLEIPSGYVGLIYARSGLASKQGLNLINSVGVIDSDYRGEVKVPLCNNGLAPQKISGNSRIAQLMIVPYPEIVFEEVDELSSSQRNSGGFGSTGIQ